MRVIEFNIEKGLYNFKFEELETEIHSHPAMEVIFAETGTFTLSTMDSKFSDLTFAVIDASVLHGISGINCALNVLMIEHNSFLVKSVLAESGIYLKSGLCIKMEREDGYVLLNKLTNQVMKRNIGAEYDERVTSIVNYLNTHELEYKVMIETLEQEVNLSRSRLSHIFKENTGISLKKYLIWCKLKTTIKRHLNKKEDLFTSLIRSGFYDQPHFSRAFKVMLGVKPSAAYKGRIIQ